MEKTIKEFVEKGADLEHDRWARWQKYMFSKGIIMNCGDMVIPKAFVERWSRQINTPYKNLSEEEKESDRKETRNYLPLLTTANNQARQEAQGERCPQCSTYRRKANDGTKYLCNHFSEYCPECAEWVTQARAEK